MKKYLVLLTLLQGMLAYASAPAAPEYDYPVRTHNGAPPANARWTTPDAYEFGGWRGMPPQAISAPPQDLGPQIPQENLDFLNRAPSAPPQLGGHYNPTPPTLLPDTPFTPPNFQGNPTASPWGIRTTSAGSSNDGHFPNPRYDPRMPGQHLGVFSGNPERDFQDYIHANVHTERHRSMDYDAWEYLDRLCLAAYQSHNMFALRDHLAEMKRIGNELLRYARERKARAERDANNFRSSGWPTAEFDQAVQANGQIIERMESRTRHWQQVLDIELARRNPLVSHRNANGEIIQGRLVEICSTPPPVLDSLNTPFGQDLNQLAVKMYGFCPGDTEKDNLRDLGKIAISMADAEFMGGHKEEANSYRDLAQTVLDVVLGIDPVTGFVRSSYELYTGKNLVTGEELSAAERAMAALGVVSVGNWSTVNKLGNGLMRLARRAPHLAHLQAGSHAFAHAQYLYSTAADLVHHTPISNGVLHDLFQYGERVSETFRSGSYYAYTTTKEVTLYRVASSTYPGGAITSTYWTRVKPTGSTQAMIDSALDRSWQNAADLLVEIKVPVGTKMYEGVAASLRRTGNMMSDFVGGGNQVYLNLEAMGLEAIPQAWSPVVKRLVQ